MITSELTDPVTGRPVWRGLPVPWLTQWSAEHQTSRQLTFYGLPDGGVMVGYEGAKDKPIGGALAGLREQRDEVGLLWYEHSPGQGEGEPLFAQVHATRQRACMVERRCQVCGSALPSTDATTFLEPDTEPLRAGKPHTTLTAPCCRTCIPVAMRLCPAQRRRPRVVVSAESYRPHSAYGDLYRLQDGKLTREPSRVPLASDLVSGLLAKQLWIRMIDYTIEEVTS